MSCSISDTVPKREGGLVTPLGWRWGSTLGWGLAGSRSSDCLRPPRLKEPTSALAKCLQNGARGAWSPKSPGLGKATNNAAHVDRKHLFFFNFIKSICTKVSMAWSESSETPQQVSESKSPNSTLKNRLHTKECFLVPHPHPQKEICKKDFSRKR